MCGPSWPRNILMFCSSSHFRDTLEVWQAASSCLKIKFFPLKRSKYDKSCKCNNFMYTSLFVVMSTSTKSVFLFPETAPYTIKDPNLKHLLHLMTLTFHRL